MKMSTLQRLALDDSKSKNTKKETPKPSDGLKRYIEEASEEGRKPPILHIVDSSKSTEITLGFYNATFVRATIEDMNTHFKVAGCSTGNLKESLDIRDFYGSNDQEERSFLIYGAICEALCRAGIPIEPVVADKDILVKFITDSLVSCKVDISKCKCLDLSRVRESYKLREISSIPSNSEGFKFTLAGIDGNVIVTVYLFRIYVTTFDSKVYEIALPMYSDEAVEHADVNVAILWITFAMLHLYVKESLYTSSTNALSTNALISESNISYAESNDICISSPSAIRSELCCTKRQEKYKNKGQMNRAMKSFK